MRRWPNHITDEMIDGQMLMALWGGVRVTACHVSKCVRQPRRYDMWRYGSISCVMAGVLLLGLAGCASDSPKPAAETPAPSAVAQAEQGKDQPPADEVQERAVRMMPGGVMPPPARTAPQLVAPP